MGLPRWLRGKRIFLQCGRWGLDPWVRKIPGEGNGYPHQYSCWQIPRTSWVWYCIIILQIVPIEGNCSGVHRISLYYFLYPYVNLQLTQKKKFNLKIFTSSIFADNILLNVVLKRAHSYQHIFLMNENIQVKNSYKSTFLCPQPPPILHSQSTGPTSRWRI